VPLSAHNTDYSFTRYMQQVLATPEMQHEF